MKRKGKRGRIIASQSDARTGDIVPRWEASELMNVERARSRMRSMHDALTTGRPRVRRNCTLKSCRVH